MKRKILYAQDMAELGKNLVKEAGFEIVMAPSEDPEVMKELIRDCCGIQNIFPFRGYFKRRQKAAGSGKAWCWY